MRFPEANYEPYGRKGMLQILRALSVAALPRAAQDDISEEDGTVRLRPERQTGRSGGP